LICHLLARLLTYTGATNKNATQKPVRKTVPMHSGPLPLQYIPI
jgi:hypothetical protein